MTILSERRAEFSSHIWNHSEDVFQTSFDFKDNFSAYEMGFFLALVSAMAESEDQFTEVLTVRITQEPFLILPLLQIIGLTRSKIITDLKAAGIRTPSKPELLIGRSESWSATVQYLFSRFKKVLGPITELEDTAIQSAIQSLNQATWPGWIRQERAKRQGHEAEGRIAKLFFSLGLNFEPREKAVNPLCPDIQIHGVSFDIISPSASSPGLCLKSTVQTSNIGQFGESKGALEIIEAEEMLSENFPHSSVILVAMVDGVGFLSNTAGLTGILEHATEFCQFATVWKAAVLAARSQARILELHLPDLSAHRRFLSQYADSIKLATTSDPATWIEAGEAFVRLV